MSKENRPDEEGRGALGSASGAPRLSLCMIVRDEEAYLPVCLESVAAIVDELIVVDTGSRDGTRDIARAFTQRLGGVLLELPWQDDFAAARNVSLEQARGDWILVLDADEVIAGRDLARLRGLLAHPVIEAYRLVQRTYSLERTSEHWLPNSSDYAEGRGYPGYLENPLVRLFRRAPEVRFTGRVHEVVEPSILALGWTIGITDLPLHHYGKVRAPRYLRRKAELYRRLGTKKQEEEANDPRAHLDLGKQLLELRDAQGAAAALRRAAALAPADPEGHFNLGVALGALGEREAANSAYQRALELVPEHFGALCNLGANLAAAQEYGAAIQTYTRATTAHPQRPLGHYNVAAILRRMGEVEAARAAARCALRLDPSFTPAQELLAALGPAADEGPRSPSPVGALAARPTITFFNNGLTFNGDTLRNQPLGGMETALISLACELAQRGYEVFVFNNCDRPGVYDGVTYQRREEIFEHFKRGGLDIFIAVRTLEPFAADVPARVRCFWTGDACDQPHVQALRDPQVQERIDGLWTVSYWQAETFMERFAFPRKKLCVSRNGINTERFTHNPAQRHEARLIYTSTPFRGLDVLLTCFPRIRAAAPEATLHVYSSMAVYQLDPRLEQEQFGPLYAQAQQPGVTLFGSVDQETLSQALQQASLFAYPNHFEETSCIAALEAMAAGLPVLTSALGALPETVGEGGIFIHGDARSAAYQDAFVEHAVSLLRQPSRRQRFGSAGRRKVLTWHDWRRIATEWDATLQQLLSNARPRASGRGETAAAPHQPASSAPPENAAQRAYEQALQHVEHGERDAALVRLHEALRLATTHAPAHTLLGRLLLEEGRTGDAEHCFRKALAQQPDLVEASLNLAVCAQRQGDWLSAWRKLMATAAAHPERLDILQMLVELGITLEAYQAVALLLRQALRHHEGNAELAYLRALCLQRLGDEEAALQACELALRWDERHGEAAELVARLRLRGGDAGGEGTLLRRQRDVEAAVRAIEEEPASAPLRRQLGHALEAAGRWEEALTAYRAAVGLDLIYWTAYEDYGRLMRQLGRDPGRVDEEIVFYTHGVFDGASLEQRGLGGAESSLIHLARELAARGRRVAVYTHAAGGRTIDGVTYRNVTDFYLTSYFAEWPSLIAVRRLEPFKWGVRARLALLFNCDDVRSEFLCNEDLHDLGIDYFVTKSADHAASWAEHFSIPPEQIWVTKNGIRPQEFEERPPRQRYKLLYTSRPSRGLALLLAWWPLLRKACPKLELHVFTYTTAASLAEDAEVQALAAGLAQPGIIVQGTVRKVELYRELASARLLVYPCTWPETFCNAVLEAQAAGTPVVTSTRGALPETVGEAGRLIPGEPASDAFRDAFLAATLELIEDDAAWARLSECGWQRSRCRYQWRDIAAAWERKLAVLDRQVVRDRCAAAVARNIKAAVAGSDRELATALVAALPPGLAEHWHLRAPEGAAYGASMIASAVKLPQVSEGVQPAQRSAACRELASLLLEGGDVEAAQELCEQAVRADASAWQAWHLFGKVLHARGDMPAAARLFRQALARQRGCSDAWRDLALALHRLGHGEEAWEALCCAWSINPQDAEVVAMLLRSAGTAARRKDLTVKLREVFAAGKGEETHHAALAQLCLARGSREEARQHWEEVLMSNPLHRDALAGLRSLEQSKAPPTAGCAAGTGKP
ncbi:MAG: glycosyltransferase [Candidatus Tectomicrobia bacterium]|nr:glycosyltransferase [Candidatus Tectomicrobia bacterium]